MKTVKGQFGCFECSSRDVKWSVRCDKTLRWSCSHHLDDVCSTLRDEKHPPIVLGPAQFEQTYPKGEVLEVREK